MSWTCPTCSTVAHADTVECVVCATRRPSAEGEVAAGGVGPKPEPTVLVPVVTPNRPADSGPAGPAAPFVPPASTPPGSSGTPPTPVEASPPTATSRLWMIVALVALGGLAVTTGLLVGLANSGGSGTGVDSDATEVRDDRDDAGDVDAVVVDPDPVDEPVDPPEVVTADGSSPSGPDSSDFDADHMIPGGITTFEDEQLRRGWILILSSAFKTDRDEGSMRAARDDLARFDPSVGLYDSNRVCFATDDVWIVGIPGFGSSEAAVGRCQVFGLEEGAQCLAINVENGTRSHGPAQAVGTC